MCKIYVKTSKVPGLGELYVGAIGTIIWKSYMESNEVPGCERGHSLEKL
jgi:hypothetical protein